MPEHREALHGSDGRSATTGPSPFLIRGLSNISPGILARPRIRTAESKAASLCEFDELKRASSSCWLVPE